jgi:hypothetical protein
VTPVAQASGLHAGLRAGILLLGAAISFAADPLTSARQKFDSLDEGTAKRGSVVEFSPAEVNAWARDKISQVVPEGIRNPSVTLGTDTASAFLLVNFLQMRHAKGKETGRLMALMLNGERPLKVDARIASASGRCTVFLTRVELSGVVLSGATLDFVIQNFFRPLYPEAHINEPFDLADNIDRIDFRPAGIRVMVKR